MRRMTASRMDLYMLCLHSLTVEDLPRDLPNPAGMLGTEFHSAALGTGRHNVLDPDSEAALSVMLPTWERNGRKLLPSPRRVEVAYAIGCDGSVRELGENIERRYDQHGARPDDVTLTLDALGTAEPRTADIKTGRKKLPASEAWQLRAAAAAALPNGGRVEFHYVARNGRTTVDGADVSADESRVYLAQIVDRANQLKDGDTAPNPGMHCTEFWCPARTVCGAYQTAIGRGFVIEQQQQKQQQENKPMARMSIQNITKGLIEEPYRVLLYGVEGVGKSTFGAQAPRPVFISSERGTSHLDVARFPEAESWNDVFDAVIDLRSNNHDHKTLVIDTLDWLEPLNFKYVCAQKEWESVDKPAYGAGYNAARDEWVSLLIELDALQQKRRDMGIVMLAHANVRKHKHPELDEFDRFEMALNRASAKRIREWCRDVLFADYEVLTFKEGQRMRTIGDGARFIHTNWKPAFDAKNRHNLPDKLPLSWADFDAACRGVDRGADMRTEIESLLASADPDYRAKVEPFLKDADATKLAQILNKVKAKLAA